MDSASVFGNLTSYALVWGGFVFVVLAVSIGVRTAWFKGVLGEFKVRFTLRRRLDKKQYHTFHNLMLATPDGTTQIDHVVVSQFGLFVLETKNMKGWIFGSSEQATWTQQIYRYKYKFQNPLRQNYKHVKALEALLDLSPDVIYSVVVFVGNSRFKTAMPENVTRLASFVTCIKAKTQPMLTDAQVQAVVTRLQTGKLEATPQLRREHVRRLRSRSDPKSVQLCPKCGSTMMLKTTKQGANAGSRFWGCSNFPQCRGTRQLA